MRTQIFSVLFLFLAGTIGWIAWEILRESAGETRLGFIESVTTNGNFGIIFDEAEWLTGKEGEDAAIEAGLCSEVTRYTCLPNDYIIRNAVEQNEVIEFGLDVEIVMQTLRMEQSGVQETRISREEFERLINDSRAHWKNLPYRITIKSRLITKVEEVYVP